MAYQSILYQVKEGVARVTVNRPDKLNALNTQVIDELDDVFNHIKDDSQVAVVIITGSGDKSFVAGADIKELAQLDFLSGKAKISKGQGLLNLIENLGKPVIAAVNGFALGGGCELALACTMRLASDNAQFGQPEVALGIIPGYGGTQRLSRLVGKGRAMELILTGDMIDAHEAYRIGLVNKVYPQEQLLTEAENLARKIMSKGPLAIKSALESINHGLEMSLNEGQNLEANLFGLLCASQDAQEGPNAFLEKRKPSFKGK